MNGLIGKKIGMTSIYDDAGKYVACTVIEAGPNVVTQVKTDDSDGYYALQLGFSDAKIKNTSQPLKGHFEKAGTTPKRKVVEFRNFSLEKKAGELITIDEIFKTGDTVSAIGTSTTKNWHSRSWNAFSTYATAVVAVSRCVMRFPPCLTFLIGGDACTRRCDFCQIDTGRPAPLDPDEPRRVAASVAAMGLRYATVTGVARLCRPCSCSWGGAC